jgi:hypothetical protein
MAGQARINRIYDNPKPIVEQATALLRSVPEQPAASIRSRLDFTRELDFVLPKCGSSTWCAGSGEGARRSASAIGTARRP